MCVRVCLCDVCTDVCVYECVLCVFVCACMYMRVFMLLVHVLTQLCFLLPFSGNWAEGFRTKVYRFKEAQLWYNYPGSLRVREGRYLAYWNDLHADGLNNQFVAFRSALAIAHILNRTLILPRFSAHHNAGDERFFDYYFDYAKFADVFSSHVPSSFLDFVPATLLHKTVVHLSARNSTWRPLQHTTRTPITFSAHFSPLGATDTEIRKWLSPYQDEVVLYVDDMFRAFLKFENVADENEFEARFRKGVQPVPALLGKCFFAHASSHTHTHTLLYTCTNTCTCTYSYRTYTLHTRRHTHTTHTSTCVPSSSLL